MMKIVLLKHQVEVAYLCLNFDGGRVDKCHVHQQGGVQRRTSGTPPSLRDMSTIWMGDAEGEIHVRSDATLRLDTSCVREPSRVLWTNFPFLSVCPRDKIGRGSHASLVRLLGWYVVAQVSVTALRGSAYDMVTNPPCRPAIGCASFC